jgi:hypothetical protein
MINHEYKLIFVHIPRTGGTAVEKLFVKHDMWNIRKEHKHLLASQAKKVYKDYWNDYFKFSVVRDPWARTISMLNFSEFFKLRKTNQGKVDLNSWINKYQVENTNIIIENDNRFSNCNQLFNNKKHIEKQIYLNVLDEELDYICTFDNLGEDIKYILEKNNLKSDIGNYFKKPAISYENYFTEETKQQVYDLYENDIKFFNFKFDDGKLLKQY